MKPDIKNMLYETLPELYRVMDSQQEPSLPLQRFLQVFGVGFDEIEKYIDDSAKVFNFDEVDSSLIDSIADSLGFKMHYTLSESAKRRFLKAIPIMYRAKGSSKSFEYLAREIYSQSAIVNVKPLVPQTETNKKLVVEVAVDGDLDDLDIKAEQFSYMAEQFRPVNFQLLMSYVMNFFETLGDQTDSLELAMYSSSRDYMTDKIVVDGLSIVTLDQPSEIIIFPDVNIGMTTNSGTTFAGQEITYFEGQVDYLES